MNSAQY